VPGLSEVISFAGMSMRVGSSGLRHIGNFIEHTANDMVQGVLAGGILYYHGMALAADCLALDENHRHSPEMTRTMGEALNVACAPAGRLLRDQVRRMREFLRERQRMVFDAAVDAASNRVGKLRTTASSAWAGMKEATGFSGKTTGTPSD
jgi:lysyl-tRNA synthetase class I